MDAAATSTWPCMHVSMLHGVALNGLAAAQSATHTKCTSCCGPTGGGGVAALPLRAWSAMMDTVSGFGRCMLQAASSARLESLPGRWRHACQPPDTPSALLCRFTHKRNTERRNERRLYSSHTASHRSVQPVVGRGCSCSPSKALQSTPFIPPSCCNLCSNNMVERCGVFLGQLLLHMTNLMLSNVSDSDQQNQQC